MQRREGRLRLDGELVEREMLGRLRDGAGELGAPGRDRLAWTRIDQIEGIALENPARDRDRVERLAHRVEPAELLEYRVVERLHAERDPVDARRPIAAKARPLHARWIGLERDLDIGRESPMPGPGV